MYEKVITIQKVQCYPRIFERTVVGHDTCLMGAVCRVDELWTYLEIDVTLGGMRMTHGLGCNVPLLGCGASSRSVPFRKLDFFYVFTMRDMRSYATECSLTKYNLTSLFVIVS